jgi:hypothetical protein
MTDRYFRNQYSQTMRTTVLKVKAHFKLPIHAKLKIHTKNLILYIYI